MKDNRKAKERIITIILICAVLVTGGISLHIALANQRAENEYERLRQENLSETEENNRKEASVETTEPEKGEQRQALAYPAVSVDFESLKNENPDFIGWFYFPALEISYPVVQGEDNEYYLERSFQGEKIKAGSIFADCEASDDWSDRNTFVFGHNMRDGSMFGSLKKLLMDVSICEENPYFYLYLENGVNVYEIFSCYQTTSDSDMYMTFRTDESYDEYAALAKEKSAFAFERDMSDRGNIVTLSTCHGSSGSKKRILVHGALNGVGGYQ